MATRRPKLRFGIRQVATDRRSWRGPRRSCSSPGSTNSRPSPKPATSGQRQAELAAEAELVPHDAVSGDAIVHHVEDVDLIDFERPAGADPTLVLPRVRAAHSCVRDNGGAFGHETLDRVVE